jgi:hypothetical protein
MHDDSRQAAPRTTEQADPTAERLVVSIRRSRPVAVYRRSPLSAEGSLMVGPGAPNGVRLSERCEWCVRTVRIGPVPVGPNHPSSQASSRGGSGSTSAESGESELRDAKRPRPEGERRRAGSKRCIHILLTRAATWKHPRVPGFEKPQLHLPPVRAPLMMLCTMGEAC